MAEDRKLLTLGPGSIQFGRLGSTLDISCQVTDFKLTAEADAEDSETVLCGKTIAGARVYAWTMEFTAFQDLDENGLIDWTWKHKGTEVPFKFVPNSAGKGAITGTVTVDPVEIGGTVSQKNKSEVEWTLVGEPVLDVDASDHIAAD